MACQLNGSNHYLTTSFSADFELPADFAISYRVKFNSFSGSGVHNGLLLGRGAFISSGATAVVSAWWLRCNPGFISLMRYLGSDTTFVEYSRNFTFATGVWYTITATRVGTVLRLYIDDLQQGADFTGVSTAYTQITGGAPQDLWLGRAITGDSSQTSNGDGTYSSYTNGHYAEVAIWKGAGLSPQEVASLAAGFTPDQIRPQSLQFYAPLVRDLVDIRGGRAITNVNGATASTHPRIIR